MGEVINFPTRPCALSTDLLTIDTSSLALPSASHITVDAGILSERDLYAILKVELDTKYDSMQQQIIYLAGEVDVLRARLKQKELEKNIE